MSGQIATVLDYKKSAFRPGFLDPSLDTIHFGEWSSNNAWRASMAGRLRVGGQDDRAGKPDELALDIRSAGSDTLLA